MIRNIQKLSGTALVADVFIILGLIYIFSSEIGVLAEHGIAKVELFNREKFPLLIGCVTLLPPSPFRTKLTSRELLVQNRRLRVRRDRSHHPCSRSDEGSPQASEGLDGCYGWCHGAVCRSGDIGLLDLRRQDPGWFSRPFHVALPFPPHHLARPFPPSH
jgi:hypothetical protein